MTDVKRSLERIIGKLILIFLVGGGVFLILDIGGYVVSGPESNRQYELRLENSMRELMSAPPKQPQPSGQELERMKAGSLKMNKEIDYSIMKEYKSRLAVVLIIVFASLSVFRKRPHELVFGAIVVFLSLQFSFFSP